MIGLIEHVKAHDYCDLKVVFLCERSSALTLGVHRTDRDLSRLRTWIENKQVSITATVEDFRKKGCDGWSFHVNAHFILYHGQERSGRSAR
jgi:hypothetical protein